MNRSAPPAVLYVDDERANLDVFRRWFDEDLRVLTAESGPEAIELLEKHNVGVLITDQRMVPMTGIELLAEVTTRAPRISRMLLTAYSDRGLLLAAIRQGHVHDYVLKPWDGKDLGLRLRRALELHLRAQDLARAASERDALRDELSQRTAYGEIIGLDGGMSELAAVIDRVAATDSTVMVRGESGTGKELVARAVHRASRRADAAFVRTNCAALAEGVLESELFGHEVGAFSGAVKARVGRFEQADGGTIFLDEIGDISPALQVRLLRVIQEREFERVGGNTTVSVDFRVIAATHRDLEEMVRNGSFREDLYHRLNVVPVTIPPLRQRGDDIESLAAHFVAHFSGEMGKRLSLSAEALAQLRGYDWPGNVRELRNVIERAAVLADREAVLGPADFVFDFLGASTAAIEPIVTAETRDSVFNQIAEQQAEGIRTALRQADGSKAKAARILGIPRTTLNDRIRRLKID